MPLRRRQGSTFCKRMNESTVENVMPLTNMRFLGLSASLIVFLIGALLLPSCKDKAIIGIGTVGPALGPDGQVIANVVTFDYNLKAPESVNFMVGGKRIKTVKIEGKGSWRIEVDGDRLKISESGTIFELPVPHAGVLASKSSTNEADQIGWDISVDGHNVVRVECPNLRIGQPTATKEAEQGTPPNRP